MTISSYQVENVLRAYAKQSNVRKTAFSATDASNKREDTVTISGEAREGAYDRISYSLLDILLQNRDAK